MKQIYSEIISAKNEGRNLLAILLDPDKIEINQLEHLLSKINASPATHIFIGGSSGNMSHLEMIIAILKQNCALPLILFPGDASQISNQADGILFLSLLSGRNPEYLIEQQVKAAPILKKSSLEVIPTGYILIESGAQTAVERVSKTSPIPRTNTELIVATAMAGELMGNQLIYLEAGSGAQLAVPLNIISEVKANVIVPIIVGGGIRTLTQIEEAYVAGADLVVIGTAFENDPSFFNK